jgi:4a-hydroxytetrahydrobiopterin dehydratase
MTTQTADLARKHCMPCEGGVPRLDAGQVKALLQQVPQWYASPDSKRIRREWTVKDFATALDFFRRVGQVAEAEDHHPDLNCPRTPSPACRRTISSSQPRSINCPWS